MNHREAAMLWLLSVARAADMTGQCVDLTDPANATGFAATDWGVEDVVARIEALVDPCWGELPAVACTPDGRWSTCWDVAGICADGTVLTGREESDEDSSYDSAYGTASSSWATTRTVVVTPDPAAGLAWSELSLTVSHAGASSSTEVNSAWDYTISLSLDAVGVVDLALPAGGHLEASRSHREDTMVGVAYHEGWDDGACAWEVDAVGQVCDYPWWTVEALGHTFALDDLGGCDHDEYQPFAIVDDINLGPVWDYFDWALIEPSALLDVDGDGYGEAYDCDDLDPEVHPCATERAETRIDENCDGDPGRAEPDTAHRGARLSPEAPGDIRVGAGSDPSEDTGEDTAGDPSGDTGRAPPALVPSRAPRPDPAAATDAELSVTGCATGGGVASGGFVVAGLLGCLRRRARAPGHRR